tara:strand:+ start:541 stop:738 length:198 start_codon:yes stop_codon:yes gene_type:complete
MTFVNVSTAEHIFSLTAEQSHAVFLDIISQLKTMQRGEEDWDLEAQAHRIMNNAWHYPEFFPQLR